MRRRIARPQLSYFYVSKMFNSGFVDEKIPELYATEDMSFERKVIHQRYEIKHVGFYWLIAELDREKNLAFGYANLNDYQNAEWGYISIEELLENGAELDREWKPCVYRDTVDPLMVNPDVMGKKNLFKVACTHPELPIEGEHDRSLTLSDAGSPRSTKLLKRRYSTCPPILGEEMMNPSDGYILGSRDILILHPTLNLLPDDLFNLLVIEHSTMPIVPQHAPPKLSECTLLDYPVNPIYPV